ncbi:MAG: L,D-transpeptidase [Anaerolineae bacterium]|nr:L,D-transpeptidase [Anaerolineae bacterium]
MHSRIVILALIVTVLLLTVLPANAFPGDKRDERCADLIEAALTANTEIPDDCLSHIGMSAIELRAAEAAMQHEPFPDVTQVPYQQNIVWERSYRKLLSPATIYDAPNGNPVREWDKGYNYVTVIDARDGWVQINWTEWVEEEHITWADVSEFSGVQINSQPKRPFAWMLAEERPSRYPGGPPDETADIIDRYTLMNIYGMEYDMNGWEWYLVGPNQWVQQIRVAKVQPNARPQEVQPHDRWIAVDLYEQTAVAYEGDRMVFATLISSGLPNWATHTGLFQIYDRYEATKMSGAEGQVDFYFIEEVPYVMYFDGDISLHGTYWHDRFGYRQSHGCVNLSIMDAWWLYNWTQDDDHQDAWVYVYSSGEYRSDLPNWARR